MRSTILSTFLLTILSGSLAACALDATPGSDPTQGPATGATPTTESASTPRAAGARDLTPILCLPESGSVTNDTICTQYNEPGDPHPPYVYAGTASGYVPPSYASSCEQQGFFYIPMGACPAGVSVTPEEQASLLITSDLNGQAVTEQTCVESYLDYSVYAFNGTSAGSGRVYGTYVGGTCSLMESIVFPAELPNGLEIWVDSYENETITVFGRPRILSTVTMGVSVSYMPSGSLGGF